MGLTIHYKGTLTDKRAIGRLIDEVEDIAKAMNWPHYILDEDWSIPPDVVLNHDVPGIANLEGHAGLKGIAFEPHPSCETVSLFFNASCILTTPWGVAFSAEEGYPSVVDWVNVKTQFAGAETHAAIAHLLRYLKGKYLHDLEVYDEGEYWESGDMEVLTAKIAQLDRLINQIGDALSKLEGGKGDDVVERIVRVLRDIHRKKRGEE